MIIVDTGFWIALINKKDKHHTRASLLLNKLIIDYETLITTCAVMTETCHLLVQRMGTHAQAQFLNQNSQNVRIFRNRSRVFGIFSVDSDLYSKYSLNNTLSHNLIFFRQYQCLNHIARQHHAK